MLSARERTEGWVTVMVFPNTSAVTTRAEKTTVRTPVVPDPFAKSITLLYEFPFESAQETAPAGGSIAIWTAAPRRMAKSGPPRRVGTRLDLAMVSSDLTVVLLPILLAGACR